MTCYSIYSGQGIRPRVTRITSRLRLWWLGLIVLASLLALPAHSQPISITAGEHAGFTRIVLYATRGFSWSVSETAGVVLVETDGQSLRLDPARSLDRIPRLRVADIRVDGPTLSLVLACACPTRAFEDRSGVVVIDILNPPSTPPESRASVPPSPAPEAPVRNDARDTAAQAAGRALALRLAAQSEGGNTDDQDEDSPRSASTMTDRLDTDASALSGLSRHLAAAMAQGLVSPTEPFPPQPGLLSAPLAGTVVMPDLPANIRVRNASDGPPGEDETTPANHCPPDDIFAFATALHDPSFTAPLAVFHGQLFGEFDTPDSANLTALIEHYLAWGFGAEARRLLDSATVPLTGRDTLTALADIVEGRQSNARQRLAEFVNCQNSTAFFAMLAGIGHPGLATNAPALAASYQRLTPGLRMVLGPDLIDLLVSVRALDAARMTLDVFERTVEPNNPDIIRMAAVLDHARNDPVRAGQRLEAAEPSDIQSVQLRLEFAWSEGTVLSSLVMTDAATLAAAHRTEERGRRVMELAILHDARAGRVQDAFAHFDIYMSWLDAMAGAAPRSLALREAIWQANLDLSDPEFLDLILSRSDWRSEALSPSLVENLAARFEALGLVNLARETRQRAQHPAHDMDRHHPPSQPDQMVPADPFRTSREPAALDMDASAATISDGSPTSDPDTINLDITSATTPPEPVPQGPAVERPLPLDLSTGNDGGVLQVDAIRDAVLSEAGQPRAAGSPAAMVITPAVQAFGPGEVTMPETGPSQGPGSADPGLARPLPLEMNSASNPMTRSRDALAAAGSLREQLTILNLVTR